MIRGLKVDDALVQCHISPKKYAKTVHALIKSAVANATNNHDLDRDRLVIVEARRRRPSVNLPAFAPPVPFYLASVFTRSPFLFKWAHLRTVLLHTHYI